MSEPFIGEIQAFPYTFAPLGWLECNGQSLPIATYTALYSVISNRYGGDGVQTFCLPNLIGRPPIGMGTGDKLSTYVLGEKVGAPTVPLDNSQLPLHTHSLSAVIGDATDGGQGIYSPKPNEAVLGLLLTRPNPTTVFTAVSDFSSASSGYLGSASLASAGGATPHANQQPFLGFRFCMAFEGEYPIRP